jgi:tetratricopeptide (TPR) repeat protein
LASGLLGQHDLALHDLTDAIDTHALPPDEQEQAYLQRGFLREGLGLLEEAIGDYSAVIAAKSYSTATALNHRGDIFLRLGRPNDAQTDYLAALAAEGGQSQYAYYGLGRIAESQGDKMAARGFYAKAVNIDPGYAAAAEHLSALGGSIDAAVPRQPFALRPPPEANAPVVLRPPSTGRDDHSVKLPAVPSLLASAQKQALAPDRPGDRLWPADQVQLGAWRSAAEAHAAWEKVKARSGGLLDQSSPEIIDVQIPTKGRYFRLRVGSLPGENAMGTCARLAVKGLDCFAVRD